MTEPISSIPPLLFRPYGNHGDIIPFAPFQIPFHQYPAPLFQRFLVLHLLRTKWAGRNLFCYEETDSTNLRIKQLGNEGAPHGTLAVAEQQTAGRGRRGRSWESPAGCSIYMSILLRPDIDPDKAPMLTLVAACSVAEALDRVGAQLPDAKDVSVPTDDACGKDTGKPRVQIKWPNDIIINGKKLVGILTEMNLQSGEIGVAVFIDRRAGGVGVDRLRPLHVRVLIDDVRAERLIEEVGERPLYVFLRVVIAERRKVALRERERAVDDVPAVIGGDDHIIACAEAADILRRILELIDVIGIAGNDGIAEVGIQPRRIRIIRKGKLVDGRIDNVFRRTRKEHFVCVETAVEIDGTCIVDELAVIDGLVGVVVGGSGTLEIR